MASCLLDRPHLCAAGSQGHRNGGDWHLLHGLAVLELWRGRGDGAWRWPIVVLLLAHAASIPIHIPVAGAWKHPDPADADLLTFMIFEAAFVSICASYLFGSLVNDRIAAGYQRASLTDPLTGVTNRRGFFQMGERLLMRTRLANQPAALVMFATSAAATSATTSAASAAPLRGHCQRPSHYACRASGSQAAPIEGLRRRIR